MLMTPPGSLFLMSLYPLLQYDINFDCASQVTLFIVK